MMDCPNAFQVVGNNEEQIVTTDKSVTELAEKLKQKTNVASTPKVRQPKTTDHNSSNANKPHHTEPGNRKASVNEKKKFKQFCQITIIYMQMY